MAFCFDVFLFPSLFEGLSIVGLEAQANGLPVLASDKAVSENARVNENVFILTLQEDAERWGKQLFDISRNAVREDQNMIEHRFEKSGFSIQKEAAELERLLEG